MLAFKIDAGLSRVPFHKAIVDTERQSTKFISPHKFGCASTRQLAHDLRNLLIAERVRRCEMGEVVCHLANVRPVPIVHAPLAT
jgi:hypothetical protein